MKIKKYQNKKGKYKQNNSDKVYQNNQLNYRESNEEENQEFHDAPEYEEEEQINYQKQRYMQPKKEAEELNEEENSNERPLNFQINYKIDGRAEKNSYKSTGNKSYNKDFNNIQKSLELEKKYNKKLRVDTNENLDKKSDSFQNAKYEVQNVKDLKYSGKKSKNYNNINDQEGDYEEQEFTPKYYRNNPLVKKGHIQRQKLYMGNREENPLKSVAQKICNIVIKGDKNKNNKNKEKNEVNKQKEKELTGSAFTFKNFKFESNAKNDTEFENDINKERNINEFDNYERKEGNTQSDQNEKEQFENEEDEENDNSQFQNEEDEEFEGEENEGEEIEDENNEDYEYDEKNIEKEGEGEELNEDNREKEQTPQENKNEKKLQVMKKGELKDKEIKQKIPQKNIEKINQPNKTNEIIKQINIDSQKDKKIIKPEKVRVVLEEKEKEKINSKIEKIKDSNLGAKKAKEKSDIEIQKTQSILQHKNIQKITTITQDKPAKIDNNKNLNLVIKRNEQKDKEKSGEDNKVITPIKREIYSYKRKPPSSELNQESKDLEKINKNNIINVANKTNIIKPEIKKISKSPIRTEHRIIDFKSLKNVKNQLSEKSPNSSQYIVKSQHNYSNINKKDEQKNDLKNQPRNIPSYKSNRLAVSTSNNLNNNNNNKKINTGTYVNNRVNINIKKDELNQEGEKSIVNRKYKTLTYTSSKQEPLSSGRNYISILITSSNLRDNKNNLSNKGRDGHIISLNAPVNERPLSSNKSLNQNKIEPISNNKRTHVISGINTKEKKDQNKDKKENNIKITHTLTTINNKRGVMNHNNEKKDEDNRRNNTYMITVVSSKRSDLVNKYNKDNNIDNLDLGRRHTATNKNNNYKIGTPNTAKTMSIMRENNIISNNLNNINSHKYEPINNNKSHTITIATKEENNNVGRTYISSLINTSQINKSNEKSNNDINNSNKNINKVFVSNPNNKINDSNNIDKFDSQNNINNNIKSVELDKRKNTSVYISGSNLNKNNSNKEGIKNSSQNISNNTSNNMPNNIVSNGLNNVSTIFISTSKKNQSKDSNINNINKNGIKDNKNENNDNKIAKEAKPLKYSNNNHMNIAFISTKNLSTKKEDKKSDSINKPIEHNSQVYISTRTKRGENRPKIDDVNKVEINSTKISPINKCDSKEIPDDINRTSKNENSDIKNNQLDNPSKAGNINLSSYSSNKKEKDIKQNNSNENDNINSNISKNISEQNQSEFNEKDLKIKEKNANINKINIDQTNMKEEITNNDAENKNKEEKDVKIENEEKILDKKVNKSEEKIIDPIKKDENRPENALSEVKIDHKFDFLNFNTPYLINSNLNLNVAEDDKTKGQNAYETYSFLNNPQLSDYTKAYLISNSSGPRPELSDYTKAYLSSITSSTSSVRPELSDLTKEYLSSHLSGFRESDSKKD